MSNVLLPFARNQQGRVVSIHEVTKGLACNSYCPGCGAQLVAKQGKVSAWHFAHHRVEPCATGYESALHLAAKQLIADASTLPLPPCWIYRYPEETPAPDETIDGYCYFGGRPSSGYIARWHEAHAGFANAKEASVRFDRVELESALGDIRPDLIGYCGDRRLLIEIAVSHKVDAAKLAKIRALGLPTIEITLPQDGNVLDWAKLRERILDSTSYRRWLYHPKLEAEVDSCLAIALQRRDAEARERAEREAHYRANYQPTHVLRFQHSAVPTWQRERARVYLQLCPSHVSISVWPDSNPHVAHNLRTALASLPDSHYEPRRQQWVLPAALERFLGVAQRLREHGFKVDQTKIPPADEARIEAVLRQPVSPVPSWIDKAWVQWRFCRERGLGQAAACFQEAHQLFVAGDYPSGHASFDLGQQLLANSEAPPLE